MRRLAMTLALAAGLGCASRTEPDPNAPLGITANVITAEELRSAGQLGGTLYEAVQRMRPSFLIDRTAGPRRTTQPIQVSVNRGQLSPISTLNSIPASTVSEVRYLTLGEATQRLGGRVTGPVILVTLSTRLIPDP